MRIMILTTEMDRGGAETHIFCLCRYLAEQGHRVLLVSAGGELSKRLRGSGISVCNLAFTERTPRGILRAALGLFGIIRAARPDVIHAHSRYTASLGRMAANAFGIPFVFTAHSVFSENRLYRCLSAFGNQNIAVSCDIKRKLIEEYGLHPDRIRVIGNGIDTKRFRCSANGGGSGIVFMSRLDPDCSRGAYSLIRIMPRLYKEQGVRELTLIGGGSELPRLRAQAKRVMGQGTCGFKIVFTGNLVCPEAELSNACLFVGVSRAAMEAMAMGIPSLLAGNEGFFGLCREENVRDAEFTNFCGRGERAISDRAMYEEISRFFALPLGERKRLGEWSRRYIEKYHSTLHMGRETERAYREAVGYRGADRKKKCTVCGYYGYGNMGDDALLFGSLERARGEGYGHISLLTKNGKRDERKYGTRCVRRYSPFGVLRAIGGSDAFILGGGTLLQSRTSLRSLIFYSCLVGVASAMGVECIMWGSGIGTLEGRLSKKLAGAVLSSCRYAELRDEYSLAAAKRLSAASCLCMRADMGEGTVPCERIWGEYIKMRYGIDGEYIIVAPKGGEDREETARLALRALYYKSLGYKPVFAALYPEEDIRLCRRLSERLSGICVDRVSPSEFLYLASGARCVLGMRLHALILASLGSTEFEGFGSDEKIKNFCLGKYF